LDGGPWLLTVARLEWHKGIDTVIKALAGVRAAHPGTRYAVAGVGDRRPQLAQLARDQGVTTVFTEETVSPRIAQTLARDAGGLRTEVLSPLESLSKKERADKADYFSLMDANLGKIATALGCPPRS